MRYQVIQEWEIIDGVPTLLNSQAIVLTNPEDIVSLMLDELKTYSIKYIKRKEYIGIKGNRKGYEFIIIPRQNKIIIGNRLDGNECKLFPCLKEKSFDLTEDKELILDFLRQLIIVFKVKNL